MAQTDAGFLKGFVVIESEVDLDVVAVYTASGREGQEETLHTERAHKSELSLVSCIPSSCVDHRPALAAMAKWKK
jgi:hypothetical protein